MAAKAELEYFPCSNCYLLIYKLDVSHTLVALFNLAPSRPVCLVINSVEHATYFAQHFSSFLIKTQVKMVKLSLLVGGT